MLIALFLVFQSIERGPIYVWGLQVVLIDVNKGKAYKVTFVIILLLCFRWSSLPNKKNLWLLTDSANSWLKSVPHPL